MKKLFVCLFVCLFICGNARADTPCSEMPDPKIDLIFHGKIISAEALRFEKIEKNNRLNKLQHNQGGFYKATFEITKIIKGDYDKKQIHVYEIPSSLSGLTSLYGKDLFVAGSYRNADDINSTNNFFAKHFNGNAKNAKKVFWMFQNVCKKEEYYKYKFRYAKPEDLTNADYQ